MKNKYKPFAWVAMVGIICISMHAMAQNTHITKVNGVQARTSIQSSKAGINASYQIRSWGSGEALVFHVENTGYQPVTVQIFYPLGDDGKFGMANVTVGAGQTIDGETPGNVASALVVRLTPQQVEYFKKNNTGFRLMIQ